METETTYLDNLPDVLVTNARVILFGTTYATAQVTSVRLALIAPSRTLPVLLVLGGILLLCFQFWVWGIILTVGAGLWLFLMQNQYAVRIGVAGGERDALVTEDRAFADEVVAAISQAIVGRG